MSEIKLIATDLDGTFLENEYTPHPENVRMVQACKAAGIAVCVCTGRNWSEAKGVVQKAGIDTYCVINNGAAIIDIPSERRIYRNRFAPEALRAIAALVEQEYPDCAFGVSATYASHELEPRMHEGFRRYIERVRQREPERMANFKLDPTLDALLQGCENDAQRIDLGLDVYANAQTLSKKLLHLGGVEITTSGGNHMEITPKDGTKAETLSVLADIYDAKPENVMAFGDSFNDLHMLMWAGTGVAMGNADERLKAVADLVTDTNVNGGVAKAVYQVALHRV